MIIETAIISLAAVIVASLTTANAVHKRYVAAEDIDVEVRRVLERARKYEVIRRDNENNPMEIREQGLHKVREIDEELLKLARGEK